MNNQQKQELRSSLETYAINILLVIFNIMVFILLGYITSGLLENKILQDIVQISFPFFGMFLQYLETKYDFFRETGIIDKNR
jgi:hypothetical protein